LLASLADKIASWVDYFCEAKLLFSKTASKNKFDRTGKSVDGGDLMLKMAAATSTSTSPTPSDSTSVSDSAKSLLTGSSSSSSSSTPSYTPDHESDMSLQALLTTSSRQLTIARTGIEGVLVAELTEFNWGRNSRKEMLFFPWLRLWP
jgi:hypothetical protein